MFLSEFSFNVGSICVVALLVHVRILESNISIMISRMLISGEAVGRGNDDYKAEEEHIPLNFRLNVKKSTVSMRGLQCRSADTSLRRRSDSRNQLRHLLTDPENMTHDKGEEEGEESHTEMCYGNEKEENNKLDENPPTLDPNLVPPSVPEMKIETNNSILVSWRAPVRKKYPIDYFLVEFYRYKGREFCSKGCTCVNNEPKSNSSSESYHEELIDCLEPNFDYKFRIFTIYWTGDFIPSRFCEPIKLVEPS
ncbi:unnamed protein product [Bemisia tabaci]|uniref:Fibronectin type-III domain-containing protein n=1 Tax=Bemisia tabaci TaxID=7038 RepID=A0A9P0A4F3_BEMTA|nr:unnamed protein product [Bemisia tabaci]